MRAADPPTVTLKLSTAKAIDVGDVGVAKLPVLSVLDLARLRPGSTLHAP
jgi:hypothetical protein